jgi:hypothetical protein
MTRIVLLKSYFVKIRVINSNTKYQTQQPKLTACR